MRPIFQKEIEHGAKPLAKVAPARVNREPKHDQA